MELNQLYYFRVAAETQNLTEAAEKLHISQPTLSKVIKRLENDLGVKLFDRRPAHLELNPYGSSFLVYVNQALDALERGHQYMETMKTGEHRGLRLISTFLGISSMLTENYVKQHPDVSVIELTETPENVLSMLMGGHADFALTLFPLDHPEVEPIVTTREPLMLLVPESMEAPEGSVCLTDYSSARFGIFEGGKDMNATFLRCCSEAHFVPNVVYRATRSQIVHQLVNELEVCTLLPAHMAMRASRSVTEPSASVQGGQMTPSKRTLPTMHGIISSRWTAMSAIFSRKHSSERVSSGHLHKLFILPIILYCVPSVMSNIYLIQQA